MQFPYQLTAKGKYSLKNVRLETGFEYENEEVTGTKTDLFSIEIEDGKIQAVKSNEPSSNAIDAKGYLMLPAFRDMHIHLDKTWYGLPWQTLSPKRKTVKDMIAYEQEIIPELLKTSVERAEQTDQFITALRNPFCQNPFQY